MHQHLVDHHLEEQRRHQRDELDEYRDDQDLAEDLCKPLDRGQEPFQPEADHVAGDAVTLDDEQDLAGPLARPILERPRNRRPTRHADKHPGVSPTPDHEERSRPAAGNDRERQRRDPFDRGVAEPRFQPFTTGDAHKILTVGDAARRQIFAPRPLDIESFPRDRQHQPEAAEPRIDGT